MGEKKLIGLTGKYCAGKNQGAQILENRGLPVLDVDKLGHQVLEMEKEQILARFGEDVLGPEGRIDRKRLGRRVFGKGEELAALEAITHPGINREIQAWISAREEKALVINAAPLHRFSVFEQLDGLIILEAPFLVRLLRARKRDKLPWAVLVQRFLSQSRFNSQYFKKKTDIYKVKNPGFTGLGRLGSRIDEILSLLGIS